jgi:HYR domain-containing protein
MALALRTPHALPGRSLRRGLATGTAAALLVLAVPGVAHADVVQNDIASSGSTTIVAGGSTSIGYTINENAQNKDDSQDGCNAADGSPATLTVSVPAAVTVTPRSQVFTTCKTNQSFEFTSSTPGTYTVTVSVADSNTLGFYNTSKAAFTLTVTPSLVTNTAPTVTVGGVTDGASYEFGNVPVARCNVTDKEDGSSSFDASLSAVTGTRADDGLGSQTATCDYTDAGGLNAKATATYSIVDTTTPLVTATAPASKEATGPLTPVTFDASAYDAVDGSRPVTCTTTGGTVFASGGSFPVGTTTLTCSATDKAGNTGTSAPFDVTVTDTTAPVVTTPPNLVVGNNTATVTYAEATATDLVDGTVATTCSPASGSPFALGATTVTCAATDKAGNEGTGSFTVTVQDATKPVVTVPEDMTVEATGPDGATVDYDEITATDDVDGAVEVTCDKASGTVFPLGDTPVTCSATDAAQNTGENSFTVTVEDSTPPTVTVPDGIIEEATSAAGAKVTFSSSARDLVDGDVASTCEPASGTTFPLGTTTVTCSATDHADNTGSADFTVTVRDTTPPAVEVPTVDDVEATGPDGATVTYGDVSATDVVDGPVTPTCSQASGTVFPLGKTTVTCTATDAAGNPGTGSFTVKVVDTTRPEVQAPANLVVGNTSSTGAGNVVYTGATAHDLVSGDLPVSCTPASGSTFPLGTTTVTCTATDEAGNTGKATFTVEVQDWTKPVVAVPPDITTEATGPSGATVSYTGVTAEDDVDGPVTATCTTESGSVFPLGTTTVTCSASDKAGNKGDNSFTVTVEDTTGPVVAVPPDKTVTATSGSGATVTYAAPTATDVVDGTVVAACDKASGSVFPLGSTTVTCTAKDQAGNTGTGSFTVLVTAAWSNVLQPVNLDGSSVFKLGSTVPVKFQLTGASAGVRDLVARLYLTKVGSVADGTVLEAISTSNATTGNLFRYDATSGQYIFNLATKTLSTGAYQLRVDLGDGVPHTVDISLR